MVENPLVGHSIYVDANTLIYAIETPSLFPGLVSRFVGPFLKGHLQITTSYVTLAEVLVKPLRSGDVKLEKYYRSLIRPSANVSVIPLDEQISVLAALIRAQYSVKLPDAIHIATGKLCGCNCFLTADTNWAKTGVIVTDPTKLS